MKALLEKQRTSLSAVDRSAGIQRAAKTNSILTSAQENKQRESLLSTQAGVAVSISMNSKMEKLVGLFDKVNTNMGKLLNETQKQSGFLGKALTSGSAANITSTALGRDQYKTIGERIGGIKDNVKDFFTLKGFANKTGMVKGDSGGIISTALNRRQSKLDYIKDQKMIDPSKSEAEAASEFRIQQATSRKMRANEKKIKALKDRGYNDEDIGKTGLLAIRQELANTMSNADPRMKDLIDRGDKTGTENKTGGLEPGWKGPGTDRPKGTSAAEAEREHADWRNEQITLLGKIEENTRATANGEEISKGGGSGGKGTAGGGAGGSGGGFGSSFNNFFDKGGFKNMLKAAAGIAAFAGALWVLSKALKGFNEVDWGSIGKATIALAGLVAVGELMGRNIGTMLKGALGLGAMALALYGVGAALKTFSDLSWEDLGKAAISITALGAAGAIMGSLAPLMFTGALAIGALGVALVPFGYAANLAADAFETFATNILKLNDVDGSNLFSVAGGLTALSAAMVAFGAANAVGGVTNLVSGLLSAIGGQKSPVEQLIEIGRVGPGVQAAGEGITVLAEGLRQFKDIDEDQLKAISKLPNEKIVALGKAIGSARTDASGGAVSKSGGSGRTKTVGWKPNTSGEMSDAEMSIDMRKNDPKAYEEFQKRKNELINEKAKKYKGRMSTIARKNIAREAEAEAWAEAMAKYKGKKAAEKAVSSQEKSDESVSMQKEAKADSAMETREAVQPAPSDASKSTSTLNRPKTFGMSGYIASEAEKTPEWQKLYKEQKKGATLASKRAARSRAHMLYRDKVGSGEIKPPSKVMQSDIADRSRDNALKSRSSVPGADISTPSAQNAEASGKKQQQAVVVSAPTNVQNNNSSTNVGMSKTTRNQDKSFGKYITKAAW